MQQSYQKAMLSELVQNARMVMTVVGWHYYVSYCGFKWAHFTILLKMR